MATYQDASGSVNTQAYFGNSTTGGGFLDSLGTQAVNILGAWASTEQQVKVIKAQQQAGMQPTAGASVAVSQQGVSLSPGFLMLIGLGVAALFILKD